MSDLLTEMHVLCNRLFRFSVNQSPQRETRPHSLRGRFDQPLHHASLVVLQQRQVEAVLVGAAAAAAGAVLYRLHLHQGAVGVVLDHEALRAAREKEREKP